MRTIDGNLTGKLKHALEIIAGCIADLRGIRPESMIPENPGYETVRDAIDSAGLGGRRLLAGRGIRMRSAADRGAGKYNGFLIQFADLRLPDPRFFETATPAEFSEWLAGYEQSVAVGHEILSVLEIMLGKTNSETADKTWIASAKKRYEVMAQSGMYPPWAREWYDYCSSLLASVP